MHFQESQIETFLANFNKVKEKIRNFEGNQFLELYQDKQNPCVFFTYSYWEAEENLEAYKSSGHLELIEGAFQLTAQGRLIADRLVREALA